MSHILFAPLHSETPRLHDTEAVRKDPSLSQPGVYLTTCPGCLLHTMGCLLQLPGGSLIPACCFSHPHVVKCTPTTPRDMHVSHLPGVSLTTPGGVSYHPRGSFTAPGVSLIAPGVYLAAPGGVSYRPRECLLPPPGCILPPARGVSYTPWGASYNCPGGLLHLPALSLTPVW